MEVGGEGEGERQVKRKAQQAKRGKCRQRSRGNGDTRVAAVNNFRRNTELLGSELLSFLGIEVNPGIVNAN